MERKYSTMTISLPQTHDSVALRYTLERLAYKLGYTQGATWRSFRTWFNR